MPVTHRFARLTKLPGGVQRPDVWLLGSSPQSGIWAAELGLPYAFADFINPVGGAEIAERYRQHYVPSKQHPQPRVVVAIWVLCADTDAEANRLAASSRMAFTLFLQGRLIAVPPVDTALKFQEEHAADLDALGRRRRWLVGSPATVKPGIEEAGCGVRRGRSDDRDDHVRPCSAEAIVRVARRSVRVTLAPAITKARSSSRRPRSDLCRKHDSCPSCFFVSS